MKEWKRGRGAAVNGLACTVVIVRRKLRGKDAVLSTVVHASLSKAGAMAPPSSAAAKRGPTVLVGVEDIAAMGKTTDLELS